MAWTNGFISVSNTGTWLEFFTQLKETIKERTGFDVIDGETDYTFTIDLGDGFTCVVQDNTITSSSVTQVSNGLKLVFYLNGTSITTTTTIISYIASGKDQNTAATRAVKLFTYSSTKILGIGSYNATTIGLNSNSFMVLNMKDITTGKVTKLYKMWGTALYDSDGNSYTLNTPITQSSRGIVRINPFVQNSNGSILGYITDMYNCTTVTPYKYYLINNDKHYALDSNLIIGV